jgi:hypothetical protein
MTHDHEGGVGTLGHLKTITAEINTRKLLALDFT